jgi:hypothetical protein
MPSCSINCARCCWEEYLQDKFFDVELCKEDVVPAYMEEQRDGSRWMRRHSNGACIALCLETRKCIIYETRPCECRNFICKKG